MDIQAIAQVLMQKRVSCILEVASLNLIGPAEVPYSKSLLYDDEHQELAFG